MKGFRTPAGHDWVIACAIHCNSTEGILADGVVKVFRGDIHDGDVYMVERPATGADTRSSGPGHRSEARIFVDGEQVFWTDRPYGHQQGYGRY